MPNKPTTTVDKRILELCEKVTGKRPRTVIDHILKYGFITTEQLKDTYGYSHPPRAIRDVREQGIPLDRFAVDDKTGRKIGAYSFGDPSKITHHKLGGRKTFSKKFKQLLLERDSSRCALCYENYNDRYLTIDHRVPYEVSGDATADEHNPEAFMLVCGTCQRKKSWSCEQCKNWTGTKDYETCKSCYWASPEDYKHLAEQQIRRIELTWTDEDVKHHDELIKESVEKGISLPDLIKKKLS